MTAGKFPLTVDQIPDRVDDQIRLVELNENAW